MEAEGLGRLATEREPVALKGITMIQSIAKKCAWDVKRLTQAEGFIAVAIAWNGTWEIETRGDGGRGSFAVGSAVGID